MTLRGVPDERTGYLADIGEIDRVVRSVLLTRLGPSLDRPARVVEEAAPFVPLPRPASLLRALLDDAPRSLGPGVTDACIRLTPHHSMTMAASSRDRVILLQHFEFAASHRLHCREFSAKRNRELFGKCNNPNGHGHNYRLEVAVESEVDEDGATRPDLHAIESIVSGTVIDRLDHKHLNLDVPEFEALNPSVENIARVVHGLLVAPVGAAGGTLRFVSVWETEKTGCTYPAQV